MHDHNLSSDSSESNFGSEVRGNTSYMTKDCVNWNINDVKKWAEQEKLGLAVERFLFEEEIDGKCLLMLKEADLRGSQPPLPLGKVKNLMLAIRNLQRDNYSSLIYLGLIESHEIINSYSPPHHNHQIATTAGSGSQVNGEISPPLSVDGRATSIPPEVFKTMISLGYAFLVTWITAFVMVVVHERVPDMKRYPPLPDIFLDNVPHIPWAFHMCEITGTVLFVIWLCVLSVHKHRLVLLRRFFALAGTVFLLRCVTMLITSLSVPGTHLQCTSTDHKLPEDSAISISEAFSLRIQRAYTIWSGLGMSIQGVRTCGDYMFSGHTVTLTLLNFFITEYTPRHLYFLHTITWLLNMFGIFFILSAHEHYSIDVFVAFYITSRLFLYYHTLANNQALMSHDSNRTRIWFPMFSYFESSVDGIIPNEFDSVKDILKELFWGVVYLKDICMLTARRINLDINKNMANLNNSSPTISGINMGNVLQLTKTNDISKESLLINELVRKGDGGSVNNNDVNLKDLNSSIGNGDKKIA